MLAKLYRAKDKFTGLKHCSTKKPMPEDYLFSGSVSTRSLSDIDSALDTISRQYLSKFKHNIKPGDIIVINGFAYMSLTGGWINVSFNEKEAFV